LRTIVTAAEPGIAGLAAAGRIAPSEFGSVLSEKATVFPAAEKAARAIEAATAAVYLHGLTGDLLKDEMGDTGLAANDLAERIPLAIKRLREA